MPWRRAWQPTPVFLPGESPWMEEPGGLRPGGHRESDTTEGLGTCTHTLAESTASECRFSQSSQGICSVPSTVLGAKKYEDEKEGGLSLKESLTEEFPNAF